MARQRAEVLHPPGLPEKRVIDGIVEGLAPTDNLARLAQTEGIALVVTASGEGSEVRHSAVLPKPAAPLCGLPHVDLARAQDLAVDVYRGRGCNGGAQPRVEAEDHDLSRAS